MRLIGTLIRVFVRFVLLIALVVGLALAVSYPVATRALGILSEADPAVAGANPLNWAQSAAIAVAGQVFPLFQPNGDGVVPGRSFRDCADCPEMIEIPPGWFLIGSPLFEPGRFAHVHAHRPYWKQIQFANREGPRRLIHIGYPFALSKTEVTFEHWDAAQDDPDWERLTGEPAYKPVLDAPDRAVRAATGIDRYHAEAFAKWLSAKTGQRYRLPTEAEWEYAARAGTTTTFPWGNEMGMDNAYCAGCTTKITDGKIAPVASFPPNGFGLHDMIGNGWDWVADCFVPWHHSDTANGAAHMFADCEFGVFRGGSFHAPEEQNRSAMRVGPHPDNDGEGSVIRLLREL